MASIADLTVRPVVGDPRSLAELLGRPGVLRTGHYRLLSGLHTEYFLAFSQIAQDARAVRELASDLGAVCAPWLPTMVLAPSTAGVALGGELARELCLPLHLASLDSVGRADGLLGGVSIAGHRVLLVNDVVTTGDGLAALQHAVEAAEASVAGAAWFASRSDAEVGTRIGAPVVMSAALDLAATHADECALCRSGDELQDALDIN